MNTPDVRFFARYGGCSNVQKGFSLGVNKEEPIDAAVTLEKNGVIFFVEQNDMWYFDGHDLHIEFDEKQNEPVFTYR
ncbi:HesB/YadR/YfhF family protein [Anoxybacillus flavithermus]|uniref:HesB/YadR/YfhF family protein n=1 Tax=Anoxybacillus flavithermus TaxID=33934 RepID=UPI0030B95956